MIPLCCLIAAVRTSKVTRIKFQDFQSSSDFVNRWAHDWNYCSDKDIPNASRPTRDRETAWHPKAAQQFLVTPAHEFLIATGCPLKGLTQLCPMHFRALQDYPVLDLV